ncbi:MAG: hypothetical protein ACRD2U_13575 [Terriglobales bacterium]
MPRKKKARFSAVKEIKAMARERIGAPPSSKVVPDRRKKRDAAQKHKPTLGKMLSET